MFAGLLLLFSLAGAADSVPRVSVCFSPNGGCRDAVVEQISKARSQVLVAIYTFTDDSIASALIRAKQRNVDVQVLMDKSQAGGQHAEGVSGTLPETPKSAIAESAVPGATTLHPVYCLLSPASFLLTTPALRCIIHKTIQVST